MASVEISSIDDWADLRRRELRVVVDPIIFRTAELFLAGSPPKNADATAAWTKIERHLGALFVFFDLVMRENELPIFDYDASFRQPHEPKWDRALFRGLQGDPSFLVEVHVRDSAWDEAHSAVLEMLASEPDPSNESVKNILQSMDDLDYCWVPRKLSRAEDEPPGTEDDELDGITVIRYGGLLFSLYAQQLSPDGAPANRVVEHIIPPLRSSLYLASSLPAPPRGHLDEEKLFATMATAAKHPAPGALKPLFDIPPTPSFLPYLMSRKPVPRCPRELILTAFDARADKPVQKYRTWREELAKDAAQGELGDERIQEIEAIAAEVKCGDEVGASATREKTRWVLGGGPIPGSIEFAPPERLVKWFNSRLPGRAHRRTLVRMAHATGRYNDMALKLRSLWMGVKT